MFYISDNRVYDIIDDIFFFRLALYSAVLVVSKILRAAGLFIAYDLLKLIPIVLFLFFLKLG